MKRLIKKKKHIDSVEAYWCEGCPNTPCNCSVCSSGCSCNTLTGFPMAASYVSVISSLNQSISNSNFDNMHGSGRDWAAEP